MLYQRNCLYKTAQFPSNQISKPMKTKIPRATQPQKSKVSSGLARRTLTSPQRGQQETKKGKPVHRHFSRRERPRPLSTRAHRGDPISAARGFTCDGGPPRALAASPSPLFSCSRPRERGDCAEPEVYRFLSRRCIFLFFIMQSFLS